MNLGKQKTISGHHANVKKIYKNFAKGFIVVDDKRIETMWTIEGYSLSYYEWSLELIKQIG